MSSLDPFHPNSFNPLVPRGNEVVNPIEYIGMSDREVESFIESMKVDGDLIRELGRLCWAATKLQSAVADRVNGYREPHDPLDPKAHTLGNCIELVRPLALAAKDYDVVTWVDYYGQRAKIVRNSIVHSWVYISKGGIPALTISPLKGRKDRYRVQARDVRKACAFLIKAELYFPKAKK